MEVIILKEENMNKNKIHSNHIFIIDWYDNTYITNRSIESQVYKTNTL